MAKTKVLTAPYDEQGNLLHYPDRWRYEPLPGNPYRRVDACDWRENKTFHAVMTLQDGVTSGRSAKYVNWRDDQGHGFPMFVSDLVDLVVNGYVEKGKVDYWWMVAKRGQNYGLRLAKEDEITYADRVNAPLSESTVLALAEKIASGDVPVRKVEVR